MNDDERSAVQPDSFHAFTRKGRSDSEASPERPKRSHKKKGDSGAGVRFEGGPDISAPPSASTVKFFAEDAASKKAAAEMPSKARIRQIIEKLYARFPTRLLSRPPKLVDSQPLSMFEAALETVKNELANSGTNAAVDFAAEKMCFAVGKMSDTFPETKQWADLHDMDRMFNYCKQSPEMRDVLDEWGILYGHWLSSGLFVRTVMAFGQMAMLTHQANTNPQAFAGMHQPGDPAPDDL